MGVTHACCGGLFCLVEVRSWYLALFVISDPPNGGYFDLGCFFLGVAGGYFI